MSSNDKTLKYACYLTNMSQAVVANITPILFIPLRSLYGISYTMLGTLVVINFSTQLLIDLLFSFYSKKVNLAAAVKLTPMLTMCGMIAFALSPVLFPGNVYVGLIIGTVIFAASGGLAEVLISPVIAAIPAEHPEREMSKLHSLYAWGAVLVVIVSALFLFLAGNRHWQWLFALWILLPLLSAILFAKCKIPHLASSSGKASGIGQLVRNKFFLLCFLGIFFGGAAECTMAQWSSSYLEKAMQIPKIWGDLFGVAMFAAALGVGRTLYSKIGKNIHRVLFLGSVAATGCYFVAALSGNPIVGLVACAATGFCVAMLWPGSLVVAADQFPKSGIVVFALMAAGGDLGGSVAPQLVGFLTDATMKSQSLVTFAAGAGMTPEQAGMKLSLLVAGLFPLCAALVFGVMWKHSQQVKKQASPKETI